MLINAEFNKDSKELVLNMELPHWYSRDGKYMAITKNNKYIAMRNGGMRLNPRIRQWYIELVLDKHIDTNFRDSIEEFCTLAKDFEIIRVDLYWELRNKKIDSHNYTEFLLDGIEKLTGINDNHFYPSYKNRIKGSINAVTAVLKKGEHHERI
ncbi:MAG: hypothetical protein KAH01_07740 [Caldisericia bacterium]|nr:hypothetical protein [Caldisericia bacterium]